MRKTLSLLIIISSICIGVLLSTYSHAAKSNTPKDSISNPQKQQKPTANTSSAAIYPTQTPSPYTTIVEEYNCTVIEFDVFTKINKARESAGLNTLKWSDELYRAAKIRSSEIVINESHFRPDGSSCFTVSKELSRENIAFGYTDSESVYNGWMNSSGHKENILSTDSKIGAVALHIASTDYKYYWVNVFGR